MPTLRQQIFGALARLLAAALAVPEIDFLHLVADRVDRIERGHRVLEDHRDAVAAERGELLPSRREQVAALELEPFGPHPRAARQQAHEGERGHGLAAAGFADDAQRLAAVDMKIDIADGVQNPGRHVDLDGQALDLEHRSASLRARHAGQLRPSGAVMSRMPSPSMLMAITRTRMATPGMVTR